MYLRNFFLLSTLFIAGMVSPFLANADESNVLDLEKRQHNREYSQYRKYSREKGGKEEKRDLGLEKRQHNREYSQYRKYSREKGGKEEKRDLDLEKRQHNREYSQYRKY